MKAAPEGARLAVIFMESRLESWGYPWAMPPHARTREAWPARARFFARHWGLCEVLGLHRSPYKDGLTTLRKEIKR